MHAFNFKPSVTHRILRIYDTENFSREGVTNRENQHFWAMENPHVLQNVHLKDNEQDKFSFNVIDILYRNRVRCCIYDENLNRDKYLDILRETVTEFIEEIPLTEGYSCCYQLDGAPAHSSR